ncbi:MAG TPA: isoprenylcysteine carboxylmethyltransferase family protein [Candidatus Polarisedimenticolia bacterium]
MTSLEARIPPPLIGALTGALIWLAARRLPGLRIDIPGRTPLAITASVLGFFVSLAGIVSFRRARTTVNPMRPDTASALVVTGIYRVSRNPMYLGFALILLGGAIHLSNPAALLPLPIFVLYINRFQIDPEERALETLFGAEFRAYRARVRRWM